MNKRGIKLMTKSILEIMIAIACVIILIYFGRVLFLSYFGSQEEEQASGQLDKIIEIFKEIEIGEERTEPLLTPKDWHLVSFDINNNFVNNFEKPYLLEGENSLCICKDKKCKICQTTLLPAKMNDALFTIKIPKDLIITKLEDYYNFQIK